MYIHFSAKVFIIPMRNLEIEDNAIFRIGGSPSTRVGMYDGF